MIIIVPPLLLDPYFDLCLVLIPGLVALDAWLDLRLARRAAGWPTVQGRVLSRSIDGASPTGHNSFLPIIRYRYTVEGQHHDGSRLSFHVYGSPSGASRVAYHYSPGQRVTVHYDPATPERSVLSLDHGDRPYVRLIITLPVCVLGLALLLWRVAA